MLRRFVRFWDTTTFYVTGIVYYAGFGAAALFVLSYFVPALAALAIALLILLAICLLLDSFLLYRKKAGLSATRVTDDRLSNGDENAITLHIRNNYEFTVKALIIEELPARLADRGKRIPALLNKASEQTIKYKITPTERGEYHFGHINIYADGPLRTVRRRYLAGSVSIVKVYPSYMQMRRHQLMYIGSHLEQAGVKRMRKLGHSMEFEQIKEYVRGDDYRTINWKATARHGGLMVNNYTDEKSQQIYCVINKGRVMKMPFEGMTLLDYAINTALVLSNIALQKGDRAGLITFAQHIDAFVPADKKPVQINNILETLYRQETGFLESDFEKLFSVVRNRITQRGLLVLFTNFESVESLERELPSLKRLAHYHLLMVVFFENTELKTLTESPAANTEDIYIKTIACKYRNDKLLIAKELRKHGIIAMVSTPQNLSVNSINKYLELKKRNSI